MPDQTRLFPLALLALSCGGKTADSSSGGWGGSEPIDCGGEPAGIRPATSVLCETGDCALQVQSTDPSPPDRGDNTWVVQVLDASGQAVSVARLQASPFMPAHNHGTAPADFAATSADQVAWTIGPFDLFMPGLWELRVAVQLDDPPDTARHVTVPFCVEG